jgi:hypothetical protein
VICRLVTLAGTVNVVSPGEANVSVTGAAAAGELTAKDRAKPKSETPHLGVARIGIGRSSLKAYLIPITT